MWQITNKMFLFILVEL